MTEFAAGESPLNRGILVVEDDDDLRALIVRRLQRAGFDAEGAALGWEALDMAAGQPGRVLLIDLNLPDMSGLDLVLLLKERGARNPFIVMTGQGDERQAVSAMKLGALDYLVKDSALLDRLPLTLEHQIRELETRRRVLEDRAILLDNIRTQVWYLTDERTYGAANASHATFMGLNQESLASRDLFELLPAEEAEECRRSNLEVFVTRRPVLTEENVRSAAGEMRALSVYKSPKLRSDGSVEYVVCSAEDITERKVAEEALIEAKERAEWLGKRAEAASRAKTAFLANTSHELRTPLNGALGFLELLADTPLNDLQREYLGYVRSSAHALLGVITEVLDISKIESEEFALDYEMCNIVDLASRAVDLVRGSALRKELELSVRVTGEGSPVAKVDPGRLRQVLVNLLGNAVKFTDAGVVELSLEMAREGGSTCGYTFSVRDTGIGIDPGIHRELFEPFYQADSSITRRHGGVGLGIPICASLLRKMGSELKLESAPGAGSRFYFAIRTECEEKNEPAPFTEDATTGDKGSVPSPFKPLRPVTVLIAEDQKVNRRLMKFLVTKLLPGARVLEAVDGLEAIRLFGEEKPDIVLMDLHMPRMEGIAAAAEIRAIERGGRRTPIIAVTADVQPETRRSCLRGGMDGFLAKPLDVWNLRDVLARHLEGLL